MYWLLSVLLHGAYGYWDEALGIALTAIFTAVLIYSWRVSRNFEPELEEDEIEAQPSTNKRKIR